jgi:flagellar hook-associated protein 1 FlgK
MRSTFYAFEAVRSGLTAAQAGLDVTANNIANQSTEGYSRQSVKQAATCFDSDTYKFALNGVLHYNMGVDVQGIGQTREQFLDLRYRSTNSESSALSKSLSILQDIESNLDETQTDGLNVMLEDFYGQLQSLSQNGGEVEFSSLVRSCAQKVTQTLNHYDQQLATIRSHEVEGMEVKVSEVNTLLGKIDSINYSMQVATLQKGPTNELNDMRNLYLDQLSADLDITVTAHDDGTISIKTGSEFLLDAQNHVVSTVSLVDDPDNVHINVDGTTVTLQGGSLQGSMQVLNGLGTYAGAADSDYKGIPYYRESLNSLADSLATTFNSLNGGALFSGTTAADIAISNQWQDDPNYIKATLDAGPAQGKNDNILRMIAAMDEERAVSPTYNGTFSEYTLSLMTDIAIGVNYTEDVANTSDMVATSIKNQRESVMGVDINEETANMLKYQRAFEASSRVMTALDEALDVLINRTGLVGR